METILDMRIYLLDTKKFFKKKRFEFRGETSLCINRILNCIYGVYRDILGRCG
jgi:hypothetical protein